MGNGAYLVNGTDGNGNHRSGVAWYSLLGRFNDANQPDAYADVQGVEPGHFVQWENQQIQATFDDGNVFIVDIVPDAQTNGFGSAVGTAKNNFQSYQIFKDDNRQVFSKDGWNFRTLYWCS